MNGCAGQGTVLTLSLFLALIASMFALGTIAYVEHVRGAGFGEIMVTIAIMVAVQAQIIWRRSQPLTTATQPQAQPQTPLGSPRHADTPDD